MFSYLFLVFVILILFTVIGEYTVKKGFNNLEIKRVLSKDKIFQGESFVMETVIENNKWFPLSFLTVTEHLPFNLKYINRVNCFKDGKKYYHISRFTVLWYERIKRQYLLTSDKRGTYLIKDMDITIGDIFGYFKKTIEKEEAMELVVYPVFSKWKYLNFNNTNLQGDQVIKRWIFKDPLYIKGIREYNVEDRMKDIHWQSSLKIGRLMVRDYDYTSDKELVIILNAQCGEPFYSNINEEAIERGIEVCGALALKSIEEGIPTGMWTNAQLISYKGQYKDYINPSLQAMKSIYEISARIDYCVKDEFNKYLNKKKSYFKRNCTYVIVTCFLSKEDIGNIYKLKRNGINVKLIDVSKNNDLPSIDGVETLKYVGGGK